MILLFFVYPQILPGGCDSKRPEWEGQPGGHGNGLWKEHVLPGGSAAKLAPMLLH